MKKFQRRCFNCKKRSWIKVIEKNDKIIFTCPKCLSKGEYRIYRKKYK